MVSNLSGGAYAIAVVPNVVRIGFGLGARRGKGIRDAGKLVTRFVREHQDNYHYYDAVELMGRDEVVLDRVAILKHARLFEPWDAT